METKPADEYWAGRNDCKACQNADRMRRYRENREQEIASMKQRNRAMYERRREELIAKATEWNKANPDKRRDICRGNMQRQRDKLNNAYVRRMLAQSAGLKSGDIPQNLVDAQRELLKIKRWLRENSK